MNKRAITALAGAATVAVALAACSPTDGGGAGERPSLTLWVDTPRIYAAEMYQESVKDTIDVEIVTIAQADAQTKIQLANTTKKGWPDVIFGTAADTAQFLSPANGFAADLTDRLPQEIKDGYGDGNADCVFDGRTWCVKNDLASTVLWYNVPVFEELGLAVPTTMDEFAETALKLQGTGYTAGAYGDQNYYSSFLQSSECPLAEIVEPDVVRIAPEDDNCTRVAELLQPLMDAGVIDKRSAFDAGFMKDYPNQGKVAMTLGPAWFGEFVIRPADVWAMPEGTMTAAPMPIWDGADVNYSGAWGGGVFTVSSHSAFPDEALQAALFLATDEGVMAEATGFPAYGPVREVWHATIENDPYYAADPFPAMAEQADKISQLDRPVRFPFVAQIGTSLQSAINEGKPLSEALNDLATGLQNIAPGSGYTVITE